MGDTYRVTKRGDGVHPWILCLSIAAMIAYWRFMALIIFFTLLCYALFIFYERRRQRKDRKSIEEMLYSTNADLMNRAYSWDADAQDALYRAGDPAGTYGRFDPYTMPITRPETIKMNLEDYDDGLREWK